MTAEFPENFLNAPPEWQQKFIDDQRTLDRLRAERETFKRAHTDSVEQMWLRVPRWRRALILALDKMQMWLTPKWFMSGSE